MSIFSKLFGSKKTEEQNIDLELTFKTEDAKEDVLESKPIPQTLPEAIRYVVEEWGMDYLQKRAFINVLNDFKVLKDIAAAKHIILGMQTSGYIEKIIKANYWELDSMRITKRYANEYGANETIVSYIVQCLGYGIQKTNDVPKPYEEYKEEKVFKTPTNQTITSPSSTSNIQPPPIPLNPIPQVQSMGPYNPHDDLPNYKYPTSGLLDDYDGADIVSMKSVLQSDEFQNSLMELPCAIGKKEDGSILMFDLAEAPHVMISGSSGMGVSVCFNTIVTSLIYKKHPAELKFVMIDPKKIEFSLYSPLEKHFLASLLGREAIVTDMSEVSSILLSLNLELDSRLVLFKRAGVRDIVSYNKKYCNGELSSVLGHRYLPQIVILIDEYDELVRQWGKLVNSRLEGLSRMGRTIGIHIIVSVHRPVTSVISTSIKMNIPARVSFRVTSSNESRNILGLSGAEKLLSPGEMIYTNGINLYKSKCCFIDTPEINRINDFISTQQGYPSALMLPDPDTDNYSNDVDMTHLDPLFEDVAQLVVREQSGSTSLIQRKFAIHYNRAGRLMDALEKAGIVGRTNGAKPREVLIQDEITLENLLSRLR